MTGSGEDFSRDLRAKAEASVGIQDEEASGGVDVGVQRPGPSRDGGGDSGDGCWYFRENVVIRTKICFYSS